MGRRSHRWVALKFLYVSFTGLLPLLLLATASPAQTHKTSKELPVSAFKLISIQVSGTERYKPDDVMRASGLQLGQTVHEEEFKDAARRLADSKAFSDVAYSFEYSPEGTKLELKVKDAQHFAPARFENLVWFSDQELLEKLHAQVPLFNGQLPITGKLPDDVAEALQAMVDERKIAAQVDYVRMEHEDGPTEAFVYSVSGPRILIRDIEFSGATAGELPALEAAAKQLRGTEYVRSKLRLQEDKTLLPAFLQLGYLHAAFGDPEPMVVQNDPDETLVDVAFAVDPGAQYKLTNLEIAGNKAVAADTLRNLIQLRLGQPADAVELAKDVESMKALYGTKGYMDAAVQVQPAIDESQHTVKYVLSIKEGDIYKMGDLEIVGVDAYTKDRLQNNWTLLTGDTYNSGYTRRFVSQALAQVLKGEWRSDIHETLDRKDKTVDVTLRFDAK